MCQSTGINQNPLNQWFNARILNKGFTLIELLVVIAIISVLAGILFPVFARARDKARQTTCFSNLKQLYVGVTMYADDHDEILPLCTILNTPGSQFKAPWMDYMNICWWDTIQPYIKNTDILYCPSLTRYQPTYKANGNLMHAGYSYSLAICTKPAETAFIVGGFSPDSIGAAIWVPVEFGLTDESVNNKCKHPDKPSICFADGHVKGVPFSETYDYAPIWEPVK